MTKVIKEYGKGIYAFKCLGCGENHIFYSDECENRKARPMWAFNNDLEKPTVNPSLLYWKDWGKNQFRCHSFIKEGRIQYLKDCTHDLAGQTIDLPEVEQ